MRVGAIQVRVQSSVFHGTFAAALGSISVQGKVATGPEFMCAIEGGFSRFVLAHPDVEVELPVRGGRVPVLEGEELDLPETGVVDSERVGLGPALAVHQGDVERGPSRAHRPDANGSSQSGPTSATWSEPSNM